MCAHKSETKLCRSSSVGSYNYELQSWLSGPHTALLIIKRNVIFFPRVSESKLHFKRNMEIFWSAECKSFRHPHKQARREGFNKRVHRAAPGSNECAMAPVPLLSPSEDCSASETCIRLMGYSGLWFNKVKRFRFTQPVFNIHQIPWKNGITHCAYTLKMLSMWIT